VEGRKGALSRIVPPKLARLVDCLAAGNEPSLVYSPTASFGIALVNTRLAKSISKADYLVARKMSQEDTAECRRREFNTINETDCENLGI
jgi:hypothetical protein